MKKHQYSTKIRWTGNQGKGTLDYKSYQRDHTILVAGKQHEILGSSDPSFRGDASRYNPEDLFLSSLSACHMLWYLHLCSVHKIVVLDYVDDAMGIMEESANGSGKFVAVTLHPTVSIESPEHLERANQLHEEANQMCFIANSCNFKIDHEPKTMIA
ncbi:OsmC family protein [uncultured Croceitalea sp.]|uniref:OsmC family protein n=1 Tax=uncultured Croceitalea sp. TaxID=1798908 RepID=UPI0033061CAF